MAEASIRIDNPNGLHVRPMHDIAHLATQFRAQILVYKGDTEADGKNLWSLLNLGVQYGDELRIVADGDDARRAVEALIDLIGSKLKDK